MIGTIIGIIVGLVSIVLAAIFELRRRKYPKRMSFYILDAVRLTSPIVDELKNVTLVYNGLNKHGFIEALNEKGIRMAIAILYLDKQHHTYSHLQARMKKLFQAIIKKESEK